MNRRQFVLQTALGSAALGISPHLMAASASRVSQPGIQLYTLRSLMKEDPFPTLKQIAEMGYKEIESFPSEKGHFWGYPVAEFSKKARDLGLKLVSTHIPFGEVPAKNPDLATLQNKLEAFVQDLAEAGASYLVCPNLDSSLRHTPEARKKVAETLNKAGEICRKAGIRFAYHNHAFEFEPSPDGSILYDFLLRETNPDLVKMELDLYWAAKAKQDIPRLMGLHPGRFPLLHVKDMAQTDGTTAAVGTGTLNFAEMFKKAEVAGVKHFLVEQEHFPVPPLESVQISLKNLQSLEF